MVDMMMVPDSTVGVRNIDVHRHHPCAAEVVVAVVLVQIMHSLRMALRPQTGTWHRQPLLFHLGVRHSPGRPCRMACPTSCSVAAQQKRLGRRPPCMGQQFGHLCQCQCQLLCRCQFLCLHLYRLVRRCSPGMLNTCPCRHRICGAEGVHALAGVATQSERVSGPDLLAVYTNQILMLSGPRIVSHAARCSCAMSRLKWMYMRYEQTLPRSVRFECGLISYIGVVCCLLRTMIYGQQKRHAWP